MRFITNYEIPVTIRRQQLLLDILITRKLVETGDDKVGLQEPVAGTCGLQLVVGKNLERKIETAVQLVLPLFSKAARANNETALQIAADNQLPDKQPAMMVLPAPGSSARRKRRG